MSVASVFRVASFRRCTIFRGKAWEFHVCGGVHCFDMASSFHGFRRPVVSDFHSFSIFLTPFGCHLGSILASCWHLFEPRRPYGLHFGSILSPGVPKAPHFGDHLCRRYDFGSKNGAQGHPKGSKMGLKWFQNPSKIRSKFH